MRAFWLLVLTSLIPLATEAAECRTAQSRANLQLGDYRSQRNSVADLQAGKDLSAYCRAMENLLTISNRVISVLTEAESCPNLQVETTAADIEKEARLIQQGITKCKATLAGAGDCGVSVGRDPANCIDEVSGKNCSCLSLSNTCSLPSQQNTV